MNSTSSLTNTTIDSYVATGFEQVIRVLLLLTVVILIFTTNIMIAAVLYQSTTLAYNIKCLIGLLCCSDIQVGIIFCLELTTAIVNRFWFGSFLCYFIPMMTSASFSVSIMSLTAMLVDKYLIIRFPYKYNRWITRKVSKLIIILIWISAHGIVFGVLHLIEFQVTYNSNIYTCSITFTTTEQPKLAVTVFSSVVVLPIFMIYTFCNIEIYRISNKHRRCIVEVNSAAHNTASDVNINLKGLKTIIIATALNALCLFPVMSLGTITWLGIAQPPPILMFLGHVSAFCNSFFNWIIYTKTHRAYRVAQKLLVKQVVQKILNQ